MGATMISALSVFVFFSMFYIPAPLFRFSVMKIKIFSWQGPSIYIYIVLTNNVRAQPHMLYALPAILDVPPAFAFPALHAPFSFLFHAENKNFSPGRGPKYIICIEK